MRISPIKFKAQIRDNKLDLNWDRLNLYCNRWKDGTFVDVEVCRRTPRKSDPLRKYYFGVVIRVFMDHLGYEPDELDLFHRQLKIVFFQIKPDGKGIYRGVPSVFSNESEIKVPDKKKFVDWVIRKASIEGAYVPDPE